MKIKRCCFCMLLITIIFRVNAQVLETEDSQPLALGQIEVGAGLEFQTSNEGTESALPFAIEAGLTKRMTLLAEPVAFTTINPKVGRRTGGLGDLELTVFYQVFKETGIRPSISVAGELKLPVAKNTQIGTGKTDFTPYIIASKTIGNFFTSINVSYTFLGKPAGVQVSNLINYAVGTIFIIDKKQILFGEIYGNTSSYGGAEIPENSTFATGYPELTGGETVASFGYGRYLIPELLISLGLSYDNNKALLIRPGIQWSFGNKKVLP